MKTKKKTIKTKTKTRGAGVTMKEDPKVYDKLLSVCSFERLSFGAFGYTYIATVEDDFGFRNEKGEPVHRFLVKVVPLVSKRETYFMRTKGDRDYVVPTLEEKADHEFHMQKLLYQRGLERGYELCPSPLYLVRSPVTGLPPKLVADLEFSRNKEFTIIHEKNSFEVNLIIMEYFEDAVSIHSIVHGDWDKKKMDILKASAAISGEDYDIVDANLHSTDVRFTTPCVQSLLARVRRQFIAVYDCGIIHGDPSLSNCLINTSGKITVIDFGLACEMHTEFRLDDYHKIHFIVNSCEYPNLYKWLYKNYLHELVGNRKKTKISYELFSQPNLLPKGWNVFIDVLKYKKMIPYIKFYIKIAVI